MFYHCQPALKYRGREVPMGQHVGPAPLQQQRWHCPSHACMHTCVQLSPGARVPFFPIANSGQRSGANAVPPFSCFPGNWHTNQRETAKCPSAEGWKELSDRDASEDADVSGWAGRALLMHPHPLEIPSGRSEGRRVCTCSCPARRVCELLSWFHLAWGTCTRVSLFKVQEKTVLTARSCRCNIWQSHLWSIGLVKWLTQSSVSLWWEQSRDGAQLPCTRFGRRRFFFLP